MASKCRKFEPNIFNKLKCQACFGAKDAHSAEALENNKASRKIAKCGYLFIAPDFDFNNPLDRSRRWQRRLFRLYDDGELTYCVDEDPETIPQGIIDMNKCTAVNDGEKVTSHQFSIEIVTPNKKFYIKGTSKEEFQWWFDVLQVFPSRLTKTKNRRFTMPIFSNKENVQPISTRVPSSSTVSTADTESVTGSRFSVEKVKPKDQQFSTYRGVRNMKHNKTDKHYQEGLRKSSSLHDLTSADQEKDSSHGLADMRFLSRSGDRLDIVSGSKDAYPQNVARVLSDATFVNNPYFTIPRHTWQSLAANIKPASLSLASNSSLASSANSSHHAQQSAPSTTVQVTGIPGLRRSSFDDKSLPVSNKPRNARERAQLHRERSTSLKDFTTQMSLAKQDGNSRISLSGLDRLSAASRSDSQPIGRDARPEYESRNNETDELKMAKSSELQQASRNQSQSSVQGATAGQSSATSRYEDLMYMKKGWLIKQGTSEKDWKKHWFVLTGTSLRYFKDAKAEETNTLDGRIDLTGCYDISEINVGRNYGFKIKTNNGEYVLSAMTSGIRNNWMKAIRLVMDLQHGNKNADSDSNASHSTADDLEVSAVTSSGRQSISSIDSRSGSESPRQTGRKDSGPKNVRRHYSDVSPGNVGKMLSIKDTLTSLDIENISTPLNVGLVRNSPQDKKSEDQFDSGSIPETSSNKSSVLTSESEPYLSASSMSSMSRYVEGSDNVTLSGPPQSSEQKRSESKKEEDERRRRAKSPSARIKEKTRSISPRTTSPQRKVEEEIDYQLSIHTESDIKLDGDDKHTVPYADDETDATSQDVYRERLPGDSMHSTSTASSGGGDGMLVELLENEVDHLKEQLDSTQKELVKMHESNMDLKTRLQTAVREKDISQVTTMRRQVKEARDVIQKQKAEIENLRSKLDMSVSKLTGTEKALSESLKDLKLEKDKFMKMSSDWTRRIRNLEAQLKDSNQKFERQKDSAAMKDKECRRLENEVKTNLQKIREHEREILKLKAVEAEYKMLKEKMDEIQSKVASLRAEVKEKEMKCKKLESVYESQINEMEQEFSRERDAVEQHMEDMKKKWMEAQREASMPESWADVVQEKDDIISQLEEKVFENDKKVVEMTEELQAEINENVTMQHRIERLQDEKTKLERKLDEIDRLQKKHLIEKEKLESENRKLRHQLEEARIENKDLKLKLEASSQVIKDLEREKHDLELSVSDLHDEMDELQRSHDSAHNGILNHDSVQEVIHNFLIVEAEINEVSSSLVQLRNGLEDFSSINKEDSQVKITELVDIVKSISDKCEHLQDILKEGSAELKREEKIKEDIDLGDMRDKYEKALVEATKLRKELDDTLNQFGEFERKESSLKEEMKEMEIKYLRQIESMGERVDELTTKSGNTPSPKRTGKRKSNGLSSSFMASKEIEEQLDELEERINYVDKILKDQEANMNASDTDDSSDEDDSDDFLSSGESEDEEEDHEESSMLSGLSDSQHVLSKLDEMKSQLRMTNSKIKSITDNMTQDGSMNESDMDGEFRKSLQKCTEKIETLTSRLTEREKHIKSSSGLPDGSSADNSLAFQQCLDQMKAKLHDINNAFVDHEYLEAKDMVMVHEKMTNLLEYVEQLHSFKPRDFDILGKISKQEARASSSLMQREHSGRKRLSQKEKLRLYADRLSVEAILLGQMAYLVQRNQIGNIHRDILLREIQEINGVIFELEKRINYASRELGVASDDTDPDLVSTYAAMLAEKVVLEGQLASCTMAEDNQSTDDTAVLASLHIPDNPSILAMEVFMRSQLDSSLHQELQKSVQDMNSVSGHVMSKALLLGEVTHALQKVKGRFTSVVGAEELHDLIQRERKFSHECLLETLHSACSSMDVYQALVMSCLSYHIRLSQNPGIIESLTTTISERFGKQITDLQQKQNQASEFEKDRIQNVILALEEGSSNIKTLLQNCCDSEDLSNCDFNVTSIETTVLEMCEMLILQCLVKGSTAHLTDMFRSGKLPALPSMESLAEAQHADQNDVSRRLSEILLKDASKKQTLAVELKTQGAKSDLSVEHLQISDLDIIPDLCMFDMDNLNSYAQNLVREAMYQTQLTYTNYKHKIQHEKDMRDLKIKLEAGQKVDLPSESSKDAENDIQQSLSVFEEILETKFEDECEVLSILDKEMKQLQSTSNAALSGTEARQFDQQLKNFASVFEHELSVAQERHDVHLDVLRQEITNICIRMEKMAEAHEREKEVLASHYEEKMQVLKDELDCIKEDHEEELEQVRQDILTAVSAIRANEERSDEQLVDQLKEMTRQMASQKENFVMFLENVHKSIPKSGSTSSLSAKLEEQIGQLHSDGSITPDLGNVMPPVPMSPPPREEESALEAAAADGSNEEGADRCLLDKSHHSYELQMLKREKEQALAEEVKTTKAALDAMRKAYEDDLEVEKSKYREAVKTMCTEDYVNEIKHRHEAEVGKLSDELKQVTMHYDSKCEDYKLMEDKVESIRREYDSHIQHLNKSNEQLNKLVNEEIGKLKDFIQNRTMATVPGNATIEEELYDAQIMVRVKDAELQKLRLQVKNLENNLERATEEQRNSMTQYLQMYKKYSELNNKMKQEETQKDSPRETNRSLRRTPSFHHRARSPSPQASPKKDEHHSRDSHKRRHIDAKDLKRSKSSPSIPYVMDGRLPSASSTRQQRESIGSSSSKYVKPSKR